MKKRFGRLPYILTLPVTITLFALVIYPLIYAVFISLHSTAAGLQEAHFVGLRNFVDIFSSPIFWNAVKNTAIFTAGTVGLTFSLGFLIALLLSSITRGINIYRIIFILPLGVSPVVAGLTWGMMLNPLFGVVNFFLQFLGIRGLGWATDIKLALPTVIMIDAWQWTPFMTLILYAGLQMLPKECFEAAVIDGTSLWQKFIYITLPLLRPIIVIALIFRLMDAFKSFDIIYVVTKGGPGHATETMIVRAYLESLKYHKLEYGAVIGLIMLFITIFVSQRAVKRLLQ